MKGGGSGLHDQQRCSKDAQKIMTENEGEGVSKMP